MEKTAAIDIGTNTIRMLVATRHEGRLRAVARYRKITAMGRSLPATGSIGEAEFRDSVESLREFRTEMDRLGVSRYRACATAGLRQASNSGRFIAESKDAGIEIEVISADDEASMAWNGMLRGVGDGKGALLMDIGGGSTEFAVGPAAGQSVSLPIGVVVTWETFRPSDPPERWQVAAMSHFFRARIADGTASLPRRGLRRMVGTAGSFTTLAALDMRMKRYRPERIDGYVLSADTARAWAERLCSLTDAQRLALPGMEKGRERYMIPGMLQAVAALEHFGLKELVISDSGLLEGILDSLSRNAS